VLVIARVGNGTSIMLLLQAGVLPFSFEEARKLFEFPAVNGNRLCLDEFRDERLSANSKCHSTCMNSTIPYVFLGCLVLVLVLTTPLYSFTAS
jgi:hypothetical protein